MTQHDVFNERPSCLIEGHPGSALRESDLSPRWDP